MINKEKFFNGIRGNKVLHKFRTLNQKQVEGIDAILNKWNGDLPNHKDCRWLAYILATAYHEVDGTMQPIPEYGRGRGRRYGSKIKHSGKKYDTPNQIYYGRGFVQLTWYENYEKFGKILGFDLLNCPELALNLKISIDIMFLGMIKGYYTGVGLNRFFSASVSDAKNARKIINGLDKADLIKSYYEEFFSIIKNS